MPMQVMIVGKTRHPKVPESIITTFQYTAPRIILAEINTHRIIAKSAESSRAVPVAKRIERVIADPYVPTFGRNQRGMQSGELLDDRLQATAKVIWHCAKQQAIEHAQLLTEIEAHKQQANRILEPYAYVSGVLTATEWDNFFMLRDSDKAQPEFQELAHMMKEAFYTTEPIVSNYHLPYCDDLRINLHSMDRVMEVAHISAARCARVSYKPHDSDTADTDKDRQLAERLVADMHLSPFDHQALADNVTGLSHTPGNRKWANPIEHRQFWGWVPYRNQIEERLSMKCARSSFDAF